MEPLQAVGMPTHGVSVGMTTENSWGVAAAAGMRYVAYVATNSTQELSFASLQSVSGTVDVTGVAARASYSADYQYGVVVEVFVTREMRADETVHVALGQAGATTYYPPQPIEG